MMVINNPEKYFYVCNGAVLTNMEEMLNELNKIDEASFLHHVNTEKSDFYNWTRDVLEDGWLARKLAVTKDKNEMISLIEKRLKVLSKSKGKKDKKAIISQIKETIANG